MLVKKNFKDLVDFSRGSTATGWVDGKLREFAIDEPRLVTDPATGYSGLLLEPVAQTNLLRSSGDFSQPIWGSGGGEKIPGQLDSRGGNNAVTLLGPLSGVPTQNDIVVSSSGMVSVRIVAKAVEGRRPGVVFMVRNTTSGNNFQAANVNLETGNTSSPGVQVIKMPNDFWEITWTTRTQDTLNVGDVLWLYWGATSITGSEDFGITVDFAQLVEGSYLGSYVPTGASQVTRAGDRFILPTDRFDYRPDRGTLLVDAMVLSGALNGGSVVFARENNNSFISIPSVYPDVVLRRGSMANGTTVSTTAVGPAMPFGERVVGAISWEGGEFVTSILGSVSSIATQPAGPPNPTELRLFTQYNGTWTNQANTPSGIIRRLVYYPERLPDAQLAALTEL